MNPNDIMQQQQTIIDQIMHRQGQLGILAFIIWLVGVCVSCWVIYMFYRCQRDAADELKKIRLIYQYEVEDRKDEAKQPPRTISTAKDNPFASSSPEEKYKPKG